MESIEDHQRQTDAGNHTPGQKSIKFELNFLRHLESKVHFSYEIVSIGISKYDCRSIFLEAKIISSYFAIILSLSIGCFLRKIRLLIPLS